MYVWAGLCEPGSGHREWERKLWVACTRPMPFYLIFILLFFWVVADDVAFTFSGIGRPTSNCMRIKMKPWTKCVYVCVGAGERATRQSRQQSWKCDCDRVTHSYEYKLFIWCSFWLDIYSVLCSAYCWAPRHDAIISIRLSVRNDITIKTHSQCESIEFIFRVFFIGDECVLACGCATEGLSKWNWMY